MGQPVSSVGWCATVVRHLMRDSGPIRHRWILPSPWVAWTRGGRDWHWLSCLSSSSGWTRSGLSWVARMSPRWRAGAGSTERRCTGGSVEYLTEQLAGLADRSHRPASCPHQVTSAVEVAMAEIRRKHPRWGSRRIRMELMRRPVEGVSVPAEQTIEGRRVRKTVYGKTRADAQEKWVKLQTQSRRGPVATTVPPVEEFANDWHRDVVTPSLAPSTVANYELFTRLYINPDLGKKRIDRLTVRDVRVWLNDLKTRCQCCAQGKDHDRAVARCCAAGRCCQQLPSEWTVHQAWTC